METGPDPGIRARRVAFCIICVSFLGILGGLSVVAGNLEEIFKQLEMKCLPAPTEGLLALARLVRSATGCVLMTLGGVGTVVLTWRGAFDARLKALTIAALIVAFLVVAFFALGIYLPTVRIQVSLSR